MKLMKKIFRTYSELITFKTFEERLDYLKLDGCVGMDTFGFDRYLNQKFYRSYEWKEIRREIIVRDNGWDLGVEDYDISGPIFIHHMNPIDQHDIVDCTEYLTNPNFLISVSRNTHDAIHYGANIIDKNPIIRFPGDTCPWRK